MMNPRSSKLPHSSKTSYLNVKAFLESFGLEHFEAQIILEVCNCREYYIDIDTLKKRMPKIFDKFIIGLEQILKDLIQKGFLYRYESKKEKFCVRSAPLGRDFAKEAMSRGFSESIQEMPSWEGKFSKTELLCYDPQQFNKGEIRYARGPTGDKMAVEIIDLVASDKVYNTTGNGRTIYGRRFIGRAKCPRCSSQIPIQFSYTPDTCYYVYNEFRCDNCRFKFKLCCSLMSYYV